MLGEGRDKTRGARPRTLPLLVIRSDGGNRREHGYHIAHRFAAVRLLPTFDALAEHCSARPSRLPLSCGRPFIPALSVVRRPDRSCLRRDFALANPARPLPSSCRQWPIAQRLSLGSGERLGLAEASSQLRAQRSEPLARGVFRFWCVAAALRCRNAWRSARHKCAFANEPSRWLRRGARISSRGLAVGPCPGR